MAFSDLLWESTHSTYEAILAHPFIQKLQEGTLTQAIFSYYLQQDALYLVDFARALTLAATKADNSSDFLQCLEFANGAITAEMTLHQHFFDQWGIVSTGEKSLSCLAYTQFLVATASQASFAEAMAALLPCFWIYREVGYHVRKNSVNNNPYQRWIDTYSDEVFHLGVEKAIALLNKSAEKVSEHELERMKVLFRMSTKLELSFWNDAYVS